MNLKPPLLLASLLIMIPASLAKPPATMQNQLDRWAKNEAGGVAAAWVDDDGAAFFQSGVLDSADPRPVTADTQFEIGSISKVFTALLLAESERMGKVRRDDSAAKYLLSKDDPAQEGLSKITLLSLVTHTSGLPRLPSNIGARPNSNSDPYANYDRSMLIEALKFHGVDARVGEEASYSNFGAAVLGEALAAAWHTTYTEALAEHILAPLGMKNTSVGMAGQPAPGDLAPGHVGDKRVPNWTAQAFAPAVSIRSSAKDMAIFLTAALSRTDTPLHASFKMIETPLRPFGEGGGFIGMAWMLPDEKENPFAWHNGATAGSHSFIAISLKRKSGIVILANFQKGPEAMGAELLGVKMPKPSIPTVENATDYLGSYPLTPTFVIQVSTETGAIYVQATGQPRLGLRPKAADTFAVMGVQAEVRFERDSAGKVVALILHQNGRDQRATREALPPKP